MHRKVIATIRSPGPMLALRVLGATLLLFVGADHYYEYSIDDYSVLPTIGTLFLLNFISATAVGLLLLAPLDRMLHRIGRMTLRLAALSGLGIAAASLVALLVSEHTKLFGFMESNYRPAIIVAIASEGSAALILLLLFIASGGATRPVSRPRAPLADHPQPSAGLS
ncbi:MAG: hypothetical protein JO243_11080 [Solirubrobacterales bacterium]|nr:hypothetical protein [Solirubrobacterales bacterium]